MTRADPQLKDDPSVLVAEDNETNMLLVKCILENILPDATISEARNGMEAIEIYKTKSPDIIFMDIRMPVKNGYEATREIRKLDLNKSTPIIALTAGSDGDKEQCLQAGMDDYIRKPIVQDSIEDAVNKWLHKSVSEMRNNGNMSMLSAGIDDVDHYNEEELRERLGNKEELISRVLQASKRGIQECFMKLQGQGTDQDIHAIKEVAHKLKGIAMSSSFTKLEELAAMIELSPPLQQTELNLELVQIETEIKHILTLV